MKPLWSRKSSVPVAMHDECLESSLMTHVLPVRCVARRMKWPVGSARSDAATAAAAARIIAIARRHHMSEPPLRRGDGVTRPSMINAVTDQGQ